MRQSRAVVERALAEGRADLRRHHRVRASSRTATSRATRCARSSSICCARTPRASARRRRARWCAAMLLLRAASLALGYSGCRPELVEALLALLERDVTPVVPLQGSVGASGDLAPLAHLATGAGGRGRGLARRPPDARRAGAARRRAPAARARGQGGARADQRHPALDRVRGARAAPTRGACGRRRSRPRRSRPRC